MSCFLAWCAALLLLPLIVLLWATESPSARARRWRDAGMSQRAIAARMGVSRYRVGQLLAAPVVVEA
jgi:hypothetical protein